MFYRDRFLFYAPYVCLFRGETPAKSFHTNQTVHHSWSKPLMKLELCPNQFNNSLGGKTHATNGPSSRRASRHALPTLGPDTRRTPRLIHTSGRCNTFMQEREQKSGERRHTAADAAPRARGHPAAPSDQATILHTARGPRERASLRSVYTMGPSRRIWPCSPTWWRCVTS